MPNAVTNKVLIRFPNLASRVGVFFCFTSIDSNFCSCQLSSVQEEVQLDQELMSWAEPWELALVQMSVAK